MINEAYCSYEVSKLLKEKGFRERICSYYKKGHKNPMYTTQFPSNWNEEMLHQNCISAPTHQMACAWLREVHKLHISVDVSPLYGKVKDEKGRNTCGLLYWHYMASGKWLNEKYNPNQKAFVVSAKSYEEAIESALKYTLENLL